MTPVIIGILLIAIIILILSLKSKGTGAQIQPPAAGGEEGVKPFQGEYDGVAYTAESLESTTVTVSIDVPKGLSRPLEVNARKSRPHIEPDGREREIEALLGLGADYIDIGFNTNRAAAEFPVSKVQMNRPLAEKATIHLKRLWQMSA